MIQAPGGPEPALKSVTAPSAVRFIPSTLSRSPAITMPSFSRLPWSLRTRIATAARHLARLLPALATLLLPLAPAHAAGPGWTANATVTKLVITGDGGVNVLLKPALSGCTSNSGYGSAFASIYPAIQASTA